MKKILLVFAVLLLASNSNAQTVSKQEMDSIYRVGLAYYQKNDYKNALPSLYLARFLYLRVNNQKLSPITLRKLNEAIEYSMKKIENVKDGMIKPDDIKACDTCSNRK